MHSQLRRALRLRKVTPLWNRNTTGSSDDVPLAVGVRICRGSAPNRPALSAQASPAAGDGLNADVLAALVQGEPAPRAFSAASPMALASAASADFSLDPARAGSPRVEPPGANGR